MTVTDDFKKAIELINKSKSWLVTSHTRPDGDSVGSMKSMCEIAKQLGKEAKPLLLSPPAEWYKFIFNSPVPVLGNDVKIEDIQSSKFGNFDLVVIVDTNSFVQLSGLENWLKQSKIPVLVIDHHLTGDGLGTVEIVDPTAAATGEIILDLLKSAGWFRDALKEKGLNINGSSQIVPLIAGENHAAVKMAEALQDKGYWVLPIRPPTVPKGQARLRFSLTSDHDITVLKRLADDISLY